MYASINNTKYLPAVGLRFEMREVCRSLVRHNHNRTHASNELGVSRRTLQYYIRQRMLHPRAKVQALADETEAQVLARVYAEVGIAKAAYVAGTAAEASE